MWTSALLCAALLIASGVAYRFTSAAIAREMAATVRLDPPLATLPQAIGPWQGKDVEIREAVQRIAGNDDFVNRSYRNAQTGEQVMLYIGYTARPRTMLRHRPTVCYPSAGFSHVSTERIAVGDKSSAAPALLHCFLKSGLTDSRVIVLNYYVLNGDITIDEDSFWGIKWRAPGRANDDLRYVAQVQITAGVTGTREAAVEAVRRFALDAGPSILRLLPRSKLSPVARGAPRTTANQKIDISAAVTADDERQWCLRTGRSTGIGR